MHGMGASRGFASEVKFVIGAHLGGQIRDWARARLAADPHGSGPFGDEYRVSSLYFDTDGWDVLRRRGSYGRSKYRIRRYREDDTVFLERKLRTGSRLAKWRTSIELAGLAGLAGDAGAARDETTWFRRRVGVRQLRPVCQVSYLRMARMGDTPGGAARLTLDHALTAVATGAFSFEPRPATPLLDDEMILEIKYRGALPAVFKQLVEHFALQPQRSSKYRVAAAALGLIVVPTEDPAVSVHA